MKARFHLFASLLAIAVAVTLLTSPAAAAGPANSNIGNVQLNATLNESLTVTVSAGTTVNFTLAPNTASNAGSTTSTVSTAWVLKPGRNNIAVWAYFTSATGALTSTTGGTATIPSSAVGVQVNGAGGFTACATVSPFNAAASGMLIGNTTITGNTNTNSSRTDTLAYNIDTTVVPQLPADSYAGVLNIQAQATP
jgi:hypothetical protein